MKTFSNYLAILIPLIIFTACSKAPSIRPPFANVAVPSMEMNFDAADGDTLIVGNGTEIHVPANAFVDASGNPVSGNVELIFTEMNDVSTLITSGIPLKFGPDEDPNIMESAAMFEIRANQNGQPLELASDKSINTIIATDEESGAFDFYSFDPESGLWNNEGEVSPVPNPAIADLTSSIDSSNLVIDEMDLSNCFAFNYFEDLDIVMDSDKSKLKDKRFNYYTWDTAPSLQTMTKLISEKLKGYGAFLMDTHSYQEVKYKGKSYSANMVLWEPASPIPDWVKKMNLTYYTEVKPRRNGNYNMMFARYNDSWDQIKLLYMEAKVKMPLTELYSKPASQRTDEYEALVEKMKTEQQVLESQNKVLRIFSIRKMGIYNYDIIKEQERLLVKAEVETQNDLPTDLFVILKGQNTVIRYSENQLSKFAVYPGMEYLCFKVIENNQIAMQPMSTLSVKDYEEMKTSKTFKIKLEPTDYIVKSVDDVALFLNKESEEVMISMR